MVVVFLFAALFGGIAAGLASAMVVPVAVRDHRPMLGRSLVIGFLLVLPLAAIDYHFYGAATVDRLPVPQVSRHQIQHLTADDARGAVWAGCYEYFGQFSRGSGVVGSEGGLLKVAQTDGTLKVSDGATHQLSGKVDGDGKFRFGAERIAGQDTIRVLWEGKLNGKSLDFTRRLTVLHGPNVQNTTQLSGTARQISCGL